MSLSNIYTPGRCVISFEVFPPKTEEGVEKLMDSVDALYALKPDYFTCTYGAGGSTQNRTLQIAAAIHKKYGIPVASHLTCVGATRDELRAYLADARDQGVDYIVALRGDPPQGESKFTAVEGGLSYANELVEMIRAEFPEFGIAVAGYPEVHQEAVSADVDLANLIRKVETGADIVMTQLFYDNDDFFRFRDKCEAAGVDVPIVPGLLPVLSLKQVQRITSMCKAKLPKAFVEKLEQHDDPEWQFKVGVEHATKQTQGLVDSGVAGIHYYVLNKVDATQQILREVTGLDYAEDRWLSKTGAA